MREQSAPHISDATKKPDEQRKFDNKRLEVI